MRHFFLSLLLALAALSNAAAQRLAGPITQAAAPGGGGTLTPLQFEAPKTAFADSINRIFAAIDKTRIPSGILEEYGLQFIDHAPFTGTNGYTPANQLDINRWRALYGDLDGARINANSQDVLSLFGVNQRLDLYARDANVELPILHLDYHSVRTDALASGRIRSTNNRLYDVVGQNPYQANTAFAVAASNSALLSANASFIFRSNLFFTPAAT